MVAELMLPERLEALTGSGWHGADMTLEGLVLRALAEPDRLGCLVCGARVQRARAALECSDCGSILERRARSRGVWVA